MTETPHIDQLPAALRDSRPVQVIRAAIQSQRLAHGILLHGEQLEHLDTVASAIAADLLKSDDPERHPDFFTLRPAKKARQIRIGERGGNEPNTMRKLMHDLQQSSRESGYKIAVVHEADRMNDAAANAFLKTLEEPPRQTMLILLTTRPYDLLDTIRSRCFNFRIPMHAEGLQDEGWRDWKQDYRSWIARLSQPMSQRSNRTAAICGIYGLVARFEQHLGQATQAALKSEKNALPQSATDDERIAFETGIRKGIRNQLFIEIEQETRKACIELSHQIPFPADCLTRSIEQLERVAGLLEVHLKEEAALEYFMLQSLRIWSVHAERLSA